MKTMRKHDFYYNSQPKTCNLIILAIFCLAVTSFALVEITNFYSDEPTVARIFTNSFKSSMGEESFDSSDNKFALSDLNQQEVKGKNLLSERQSRAAGDNNTNSPLQKSYSYYEEQSPVVVHSETDVDSSIANRQIDEVPPKQDPDEDDPYSRAFDEDYEGSEDNDYYGQQEKGQQQSPSYYEKQQQQPLQTYYRQQPFPSYYSQPQPYYRQNPPSPQYYDDSREDFPASNDEQHDLEDARASQYHDYGNNYRRYPYATVTPMPSTASGDKNGLPAASSNFRFAAMRKQSQYREPYPSYIDDYDYHSPQVQSSAVQQSPYGNRKATQQMPQYRNPAAFPLEEEKQESSQQMDLLTIFKYLKTMWDIYQSFTSSWSTLAERRNREEEMAQQKHKKSQQIRINSKKPPTFNARKNTTSIAKKPLKQTTTTSTSTTEASMATSSEMLTSQEQEKQKKRPMSQVEPRRVFKGAKQIPKYAEGLRDKRQATNDMKTPTDVGEGRYIKGDPLKGYYDFVITEGSYKFWAVFQVGTAILIIYSTFAAIYYSKVNPLVSDYDYTDYLGGARSLNGGDLDFVDDDDGGVRKDQSNSFLGWLPRTSHSIKFILDAIDKLPTDHTADESEKNSFGKTQNELNSNENEYTGKTEATAQTENPNEDKYANENASSNNNEDSNDSKQDQQAM